MSGTIGQQFNDRVRTRCPGLRVDAVLHRGDKAVLLAGVLDGVDVVAKLLTTDAGRFWRARFIAEIDTYLAFQVAPPPVPAPRLLVADPDAGLLVATRLPGEPVARGRYPTRLGTAGAAPLLRAVRDLRAWSAPQGLFPVVWDYPYRFGRYRTDHGLIDGRD